MNLKEYFEKTGTRKDFFAKKAGMKKEHLYACIRTNRIPKKYWKGIIQASEGKITIYDLAGLDEEEFKKNQIYESLKSS